MAEEQNRSRLGRGLAALIGEVNETVPPTAPDRGRGSRKIPTEFLRPNPRNPRRSFSDEDLDDDEDLDEDFDDEDLDDEDDEDEDGDEEHDEDEEQEESEDDEGGSSRRRR